MNTTYSAKIKPGYLSAILSSIDESIVATDKDFVVEFWNKGAEQLFGHKADEVCGRQVSGIFNFIYSDNNREEAREELLDTGHWRGKVQFQNKQGLNLILDASVTIIRNDVDEILGYVAVHRNITDYNEIKNELRVLSTVLSSLDDNFFLVDKDFRIVFVDEKTSRKAQEYYGIYFSPGDYIHDKISTGSELQVRDCITNAFKGQESTYQTTIKNTEGKNIWLQRHCMPVRDKAGNITHCCMIAKDITAQKEIELVNDKLMRSRMLFETFMENSPILSWITDTEGIIRYLNPAYLKNYQLKKEHIGRPLTEVLPNTSANVFRENDEMVIRENRTLTAIEKSITPDGREHIYQVLKFPIISENSLYIGGWAIDITEEVRLKDSLNNSLNQLQQSEKDLKEMLVKEQHLNDLKGRFVSMASHEFRTPLSTMLTSAFLLEKYTSTEDQPKRQKHTNKIKESIQHLNFLLEDFLSLGKLEEGKTIANLSHFNLIELVEDVVEELEPLKKTGQNLEYQHSGDHEVHTDKKLLKNILINILTNAYKFSGEFKNIWLNCNVNQHQLYITVRDEGIGISQKDQEHLFETFFRAQNALNIQGTGLGLHIIKRYANMLGGNVRIESELDLGTTVKLELPV